MQKIRLVLFGIFGILAVIPFTIGCLFLNKKQASKISEMLGDWLDALEDSKTEPITIEDRMFLNDVELTQEDYERGTNKNLSVECRMCGENTRRGKFYKKKDVKDSNDPYSFICRDCYHLLPVDKKALNEQRVNDLFDERIYNE